MIFLIRHSGAVNERKNSVHRDFFCVEKDAELRSCVTPAQAMRPPRHSKAADGSHISLRYPMSLSPACTTQRLPGPALTSEVGRTLRA
jgi:hypothetical protein